MRFVFRQLIIYSWTAVVRGALMKRLSSISSDFATVTISQRRARKNYGTTILERFDDKQHDLSSRLAINYPNREMFPEA